MSNGLELLVQTGAIVGGLTGLAAAIAKVVRWVNRGRAVGSRGEINWFESNLKALQEENARLRVDNAELDRRHKERRDECHDLRNMLVGKDDQIQVLQMELDMVQRRKRSRDPNENGEPK